jgi:chromosome segregation ATPase
MNARFGAIDNSLRNQVKADKKLQSRMNSSYEDITNDVENLISEIDNLTSSLLRTNTTSDHKIRNLRNTLKDIKGDLKLTRSALTQINGSLRNDFTTISKSLSSSLKDLKNELRNLASSTTAKADKLWKYCNQTSTNIDKALKKMSHQNTSLHLKVDFESDALETEVKRIEKKLAQLNNNTIITTDKDKQHLVKELNDTRRILKETFRNKIAQINSSLDKKIESVETLLKSSLANVKTKINAVKNQLQTNITNLKDKQKNMKDDLSKTKINLQGVDSRHERNISALVVKMQSITNTYARLQDNVNNEKDKRLKLEKELQDLRSTVDKLQNKANGICRINVSLVVFLVSFIFLYI